MRSSALNKKVGPYGHKRESEKQYDLTGHVLRRGKNLSI